MIDWKKNSKKVQLYVPCSKFLDTTITKTDVLRPNREVNSVVISETLSKALNRRISAVSTGNEN